MTVRGSLLRKFVRRVVPLALTTTLMGAVCTQVVAPPAAFAVGAAPASFSAAVQSRIALLRKQTPFFQAGMSFADLQTLVGNTASGFIVVDPDTAQPWVLSTLLSEASGSSTWLDDSATDDAASSKSRLCSH